MVSTLAEGRPEPKALQRAQDRPKPSTEPKKRRVAEISPREGGNSSRSGLNVRKPG